MRALSKSEMLWSLSGIGAGFRKAVKAKQVRREDKTGLEKAMASPGWFRRQTSPELHPDYLIWLEGTSPDLRLDQA